MISIRLNEENFEYDIYSLAKAFFPSEEVSRNISPETEILLEVQYGKEYIKVSLTDMAAVKSETAAQTISETVSIDRLERKEIKNHLKRALYRLFSEKTGQQLPWGTLTGIRPTKIPFALLKDGTKPQDVMQFMKEAYLLSDEKAALSLEIAGRELEILKRIDYREGYSLYVGIPFCPTRCLYCSFTSYPLKVWEKRRDEYVEALVKELRYVAEAMKEKKLNTIYIGGGTPTTLSEAQLERLLSVITEIFDLSWNLEFTVEAGRPDSVTEEKLKVLKKYGVTRISVNPQTMKQETLELIGRQHTVQETVEAFQLARECGFDNINMDLISGLPGESESDMERTMQEIAKLSPDSVTVHSLAVKRGSRLNELREQYREYQSLNNEAIAVMMEHYARNIGLLPYYLYRQKNMTGNLENVGYAALDKAGIYNILIMEEKQTILAVGAGAATKLVFPDGERIERIENVKSVEQYLERVDEMIERKRKRLPEIGCLPV